VARTMLINLKHLLPLLRPSCSDFDAFVAAPSMGQFYNQKIKGTGSDGPFDCRTIRYRHTEKWMQFGPPMAFCPRLRRES
jgi:hypothetical protein